MALLLAASPIGAQVASIVFATEGGEAWTFDKIISVEVLGGRCDDVALSSPLSRVVARTQNGSASARLKLAPGNNWIEAQCRRRGIAVGRAIRQQWHERLPNVPKAIIQTKLYRGALLLSATSSKQAPALPAPIVHYLWREIGRGAAPLAGLPAAEPRLVLRLPARDGEYRIALTVTDADGRADQSVVALRLRHGQPEILDAAQTHAAWIDDAVIYGVVPKLFGPGGLRDVTAQLDRLRGLGINTLWLAPITASPHGDFGYAVTDHFRIRSSYGTAADLHALVDGAHERGMHVILDFVSNHLSDRHPYYRDAAAHGRRSPYYDFFARNSAGAVAHYFDWRNLENLNYENEEVRRMVTEASAYWVRTFHIDGFRIDAAWGPRQRAPDFWPRWSAELTRIDPDLLLVAEASARDIYYLHHGFDVAYDWTQQLGQWAWQRAFDDPSQTAQLLRLAISSSPEHGVLRFLDNNDTRERFVAHYGLARARVAAATLLTLPGLPALYTGDEIAAIYDPYGGGGPLLWSDPNQLASWYARLIALRHREDALRSDLLRFLNVGRTANVLAYLRATPNGAEKIVVLLNWGPSSAHLTAHDLPPSIARARLTDLLDGQVTSGEALVSGKMIEGYGVRILKVSGAARSQSKRVAVRQAH